VGKSGSQSTSVPYDAYYFAHNCGRPCRRDEKWLRFFGAIADRIVNDIRPGTVLDVGCALGFLVEALRDRDVVAFGVDISEYAIQNVCCDIKPYCWVGRATDLFPQKYDLIVCIEVLEHLLPLESEQAVENICQHTEDVLFSSTPFDYKEATHFNVRPLEYWGELFARYGFFRDVDFDASFVTPWAVRFRRRMDPLHHIVRGYERRFWLLWKENTDLRSAVLEMCRQLAASEQDTATGHAERALVERDAEIVDLRRLVSGYEQGRFIRFMRRVNEWWNKVAGLVHPRQSD
jgi:hypothetical protein